MVTFRTIEGSTVALFAAHVESLQTDPTRPELTVITMASGRQYTVQEGSRDAAMRLASVLRGE